MGTSAYDLYLAEKDEKESAYAKYLAEKNTAPEAPKPPNKWRAALENALDAATFGLAGLGYDLRKYGANAPGGFAELRDARRERIESLPLWAQLGSGVAGAMANPVGAFLGPAKAGAGMLARVGRGMAEGALQGGVTAAGENIGTSDGLVIPTLMGVAGGSVFGGTAAGVGAKLAGRGGPTKAAAQAARRLQEAGEIDAALPPVAAPPSGVGMPSLLGVDVLGPTARGEVKAAAKSPAARAVLKEAFTAREKEMPRALAVGVKDAKAVEGQLVKARAAQAKADYDAAVEATKGIPVQTPSLNALLDTPTGRAAWQEAAKSRPDLVLASGDPARALPSVGGASVPDAEAIHLMTRYLRNWSKGEKGQVFPEGVNAESAQNALGLLEKAKAELPEPFQIANANYEAASRKIDAVQMGMTRWKNNPLAGNRKANRLAVRTVMGELKKMPPENRALVQQGKAFDLLTRTADAGLTPQKAVAALDNPVSALGREFRVAGGDLGPRMRAWNDVLETQKDLLSASTPAAVEGGAPDLFRDIAGGVSMNPSWWATLTGRRIASEGLSAKAAKEQAEAALELIKTATDSPVAIQRAIDALKQMDARKAKWTARPSAAAGRIGGLLGASF